MAKKKRTFRGDGTFSYKDNGKGEINALKPENLDFKKKIIKIRHTVSRGQNFRTFIKEGAKTYKGVRDIPMNKLVEAIQQKIA